MLKEKLLFLPYQLVLKISLLIGCLNSIGYCLGTDSVLALQSEREQVAVLNSSGVELDEATCIFILTTVQKLHSEGYSVPFVLQHTYDNIQNGIREISTEDLQKVIEYLPSLVMPLTAKAES